MVYSRELWQEKDPEKRDELIAQIEADIRQSPLTVYRLRKVQSVAQAVE
jgi:hypothetical protein